MSHISAMIDSHPSRTRLDLSALAETVQELFECSETCTSCADACLAEADVAPLVRCIRLNLDCADVCATTGRILLRQTEPAVGLLRAQLEACAEACRTCAAECERHAGHMEHCRICAEACRRCVAACEKLLAELPAA